jgi:segregation and condensation protein B
MVHDPTQKPGRKAPPRIDELRAAQARAAASKPAPDDAVPPAPTAEDAASVEDVTGVEPSGDEATSDEAPSLDDSIADETSSADGSASADETPSGDDSESETPSADAPGADERTTVADAATSDRPAAGHHGAASDDAGPVDLASADIRSRSDVAPATSASDASDLDAAPRASSGASASLPDGAGLVADDDPDDPLAAMLAEFEVPRAPAPDGVKLSDEIPIDPEDDLRGVEGEASPRLVSIVESLLFAAAKPLKVEHLRKILAETSKHQIQLALVHLMAVTQHRGVVLAQVAGGFQFRTHPDNAAWVQKMLQAKPARLSRTQIETLAIVAYRQPITRPEIDDVRGVDSGAVLKTLLERDLIQIVGKKEEPGRPLLYGTTVRFLEFFNLRGLRDLPTLRDFRDLSEESKATLRARLGASEAEALGQGVLGFPAEAGGDMSEAAREPATLVDAVQPGEAPAPAPDIVRPAAPDVAPGHGPDEVPPTAPDEPPRRAPDEVRPTDPDEAPSRGPEVTPDAPASPQRAPEELPPPSEAPARTTGPEELPTPGREAFAPSTPDEVGPTSVPEITSPGSDFADGSPAGGGDGEPMA